jgi:uncharacterized membrane protein YdbT with pleckstrin-like domain
MPENHLKPNKEAFLWFGLLVRIIAAAFICFIPYLFLLFVYPVSIIYFLLAFIGIAGLATITRIIQYEKEEYIFLQNKIIRRSGSIFTDKETELLTTNITHVKHILPFIENKLFSTSTIRIEAAGAAGTELKFESIDKGSAMYEYMQNLMQHNGFKLTKKEEIQTESPHILGVIFEILKNTGAGVLLLFYLLSIGGEGLVEVVGFFESAPLLFALVSFFIICLLFAYNIFSFLDLHNRKYTLYNDVVMYEEGFLTKHYAFIPVENLADAATTQSVIDRIFGLYDVKLSCQGAGKEILFKNMKNGLVMEENIDKIIAEKTESQAKATKEKTETKATTSSKEEKATKKTKATKQTKITGNNFTASYKMELLRSVIPYLIAFPFCLIVFPLLFVWGIGLVTTIINTFATTFTIKKNSVQMQYDFIKRQNIEFTLDKVTAIIFQENFMDTWCNTCSIQFWSIGATQPILFKNIKKSSNLYQQMCAKAGMIDNKARYEVKPQFSIATMFKATLPLTALGIGICFVSLIALVFGLWPLIFLPILILLTYIPFIVWRTIWYQRALLQCFDSYIHYKKGIFFREYWYVRYSDIKGLATSKYPASTEGSIKFDIAGERMVQQGKQQQASFISNSFTVRYVPDLEIKNKLMDIILEDHPNASTIGMMEKNPASITQKEIMTVKQDAANSLSIVLGGSIILFPLILLLPITLPLMYWIVKVRSFSLEDKRIVIRSGIFYKRQKSILYGRIDHINMAQGMLNKMFKNGSIHVNTIGSSKREMSVWDIKQHKEFYKELKKHY